MAAALSDAWHLGQVRRGFAGTLLIALGALSPAYLPLSSPFWSLFGNAQSLASSPLVRVIGTALTMAGALLLVDAWFRLRPASPGDETSSDPHSPSGRGPSGTQSHYWAVLVIWSLPFLAAPPVFSHDAYAYAAQGWLVRNGIDPYAVGPGFLPGAFADQVDWVWRMSPAPYGPLSLQISHALVVLAGNHPYPAAWLQRVPALLGVVMIGWMLPRLTRRTGGSVPFALWFALLNPMLVISFIGGAHNDALMMGFVIVGCWLAVWPGPARWPRLSGWWWLAGALVVGIGAAVKQPAILAAYALPLMARPWADWRRREVGIAVGRGLASFAVAIGSFSLVTWATGLGFGWIHSIGVPGRNPTPAPFAMLGRALQWILSRTDPGPTHQVVLTICQSAGVAVGAAIILFLALTVARRRPLAFLAWSYLAAAVCGPSLRTWYVQWSVTLVPLMAPGRLLVRVAVWGTLVMLGFDAVEMAWRNSAVAVGAAAMVACAWLAWTHDPWVQWRTRRRGAAAAAVAA